MNVRQRPQNRPLRPLSTFLKVAFHFRQFCLQTKAPYCFLFALFADGEENKRTLWSANKTIKVESALPFSVRFVRGLERKQ